MKELNEGLLNAIKSVVSPNKGKPFTVHSDWEDDLSAEEDGIHFHIKNEDGSELKYSFPATHHAIPVMTAIGTDEDGDYSPTENHITKQHIFSSTSKLKPEYQDAIVHHLNAVGSQSPKRLNSDNTGYSPGEHKWVSMTHHNSDGSLK